MSAPEIALPPPEGRIRVERVGALMLIGVDRPAKLNGFTPQMFDQLSLAYQRFEDDRDARVAVLHAFGPHFSAGLQLDLFEDRFLAGRSLSTEGLVDPFQLRPPFRTKPCVAAMQGICFTVACELMLAADIVVAASDCRFAQLEVKRGVMANHGATLRMVERAGWGDAMLYLLTGDEFGAEIAHRMRFVQEIVEPGRQLERAIEIAERIAAQAPLAVAATLASARKMIREGQLSAVAELGSVQADLLKTEDAAEGVQSFRERRSAVFLGR
jgi:enoyl-CoA hydratase/carnithine racemase